jgi:GNAT superfamily N-acetyltransferase
MGFWDNVSIFNYFKSLLHTAYFTPNIINKDIISSPTGIKYNIATTKDLPKIAAFLKLYFGEPPKTPIFNIPPNILLDDNDTILYVINKTNKIVGCIRYHYIGKFYTAENKPDMYIVDCFCIHPEWRKKGIGRYLLHSLHNYVVSQNKPYSMFLKEGGLVNTFNIPFYRGIYVYKPLTIASRIPTTHTLTVNNTNVEQLINIFRNFNKDIFIVWRKDGVNQIWRFFKRGCNMVLACFQNTYQTIYNKTTDTYDNIAWCTAWFESDNIPDNIRSIAINEITACLYPDFQYVWMNKDITRTEPGWLVDGPYNWYLYQWFTKGCITHNFCITI